MKPSELIKQELNITLKELSVIAEQSENTIINWFNNPKKRVLINLIIDGIKYRRGICEQCKGTGFELTENGQKILELLKRHN